MASIITVLDVSRIRQWMDQIASIGNWLVAWSGISENLRNYVMTLHKTNNNG